MGEFMKRKTGKVLASLAILGLLATSCGGGDSDSTSDEEIGRAHV